MILAAGLGTRLRPLTDQIPKPLVPVAGIPNIIRTIKHLKRSGVDQIVINLHHKPELIRTLLFDEASLGVKINYSHEEHLLGTGGGIKKALPLLGNEPFIVINGDALFAPDIKSAYKAHVRNNANATLILRQDPDAADFGAVGIDRKNKIVSIVNTGDPGRATKLLMFTGVHIISPSLGARLPDNGCIVRKTYMPMVADGEPLFGVTDNAFFCDLGTPKRYISANADLVCGRKTMRGFTQIFEGKYHVGAGVIVKKNCVLKNGTVVGDGAKIESGVTLDRVVVLQGAHVTQTLKDAIVCPDGTIIKEH